MRTVVTLVCLSTTLCLERKRRWRPFNYASCDSSDQSEPSSRISSSSSSGNGNDESPCSLYNTLEHRISWAERRNRCNSVSGCKFFGRRFTGSCVRTPDSSNNGIEDEALGPQRSAQLAVLPLLPLQSDVQLEISSHSESSGKIIPTAVASGNHDFKVQGEITSSSDDEMITPLRVLVQETLTSSAVYSIRDSQQLANELAKCLLIEVLERKENRGKFGELLQYLFISKTVLSPTRELIYWSLDNDHAIQNIAINVKTHRDFWLRSSGRQAATMRSLERRLTDAALMTLIIRWLDDPASRNQVVIPLLDWTLQENESVVKPLTELAVGSIPWVKDATVEGIIYALSESLKSEDVRKAAADGLVSYFRQETQIPSVGECERASDQDEKALAPNRKI